MSSQRRSGRFMTEIVNTNNYLQAIQTQALRKVPESWTMFRELLGDIVAVAGAEGVDVSDDLVDRWLEFATDLDADSYSSLHYDMTHGKRMELETFHGTVVRLADDHDLPVSMPRAVYSILRHCAVRNDTEQPMV